MNDIDRALIVSTLMICMTFGLAQCQKVENEYKLELMKIEQAKHSK